MMNAQSYVQTRCAVCGNPAWGHPAMAVACGSCGQAIPPVQAAPPAYVQQPAPVQAAAQPAASQQPVAKLALPGGFSLPIKLGGRFMKLKIAAIVVVGIAGAIGFAIYKAKTKGDTTREGNLSYSSLKLDPRKADPDQMLVAVGEQARKWRKDATWWSINLQKVKADGTIDVTGGGAIVAYISPGAVTSHARKDLDDSLKKFMFTASGVDHDDVWKTDERWESIETPPLPECSIKQVVEKLADRGLTGDKTVRITFDPAFAQSYSWHVMGDDPAINAHFSMLDCSELPE